MNPASLTVHKDLYELLKSNTSEITRLVIKVEDTLVLRDLWSWVRSGDVVFTSRWELQKAVNYINNFAFGKTPDDYQKVYQYCKKAVKTLMTIKKESKVIPNDTRVFIDKLFSDYCQILRSFLTEYKELPEHTNILHPLVDFILKKIAHKLQAEQEQNKVDLAEKLKDFIAKEYINSSDIAIGDAKEKIKSDKIKNKYQIKIERCNSEEKHKIQYYNEKREVIAIAISEGRDVTIIATENISVSFAAQKYNTINFFSVTDVTLASNLEINNLNAIVKRAYLKGNIKLDKGGELSVVSSEYTNITGDITNADKLTLQSDNVVIATNTLDVEVLEFVQAKHVYFLNCNITANNIESCKFEEIIFNSTKLILTEALKIEASQLKVFKQTLIKAARVEFVVTGSFVDDKSIKYEATGTDIKIIGNTINANGEFIAEGKVSIKSSGFNRLACEIVAGKKISSRGFTTLMLNSKFTAEEVKHLAALRAALFTRTTTQSLTVSSFVDLALELVLPKRITFSGVGSTAYYAGNYLASIMPMFFPQSLVVSTSVRTLILTYMLFNSFELFGFDFSKMQKAWERSDYLKLSLIVKDMLMTVLGYSNIGLTTYKSINNINLSKVETDFLETTPIKDISVLSLVMQAISTMGNLFQGNVRQYYTSLFSLNIFISPLSDIRSCTVFAVEPLSVCNNRVVTGISLYEGFSLLSSEMILGCDVQIYGANLNMFGGFQNIVAYNLSFNDTFGKFSHSGGVIIAKVLSNDNQTLIGYAIFSKEITDSKNAVYVKCNISYDTRKISENARVKITGGSEKGVHKYRGENSEEIIFDVSEDIKETVWANGAKAQIELSHGNLGAQKMTNSINAKDKNLLIVDGCELVIGKTSGRGGHIEAYSSDFEINNQNCQIKTFDCNQAHKLRAKEHNGHLCYEASNGNGLKIGGLGGDCPNKLHIDLNRNSLDDIEYAGGENGVDVYSGKVTGGGTVIISGDNVNLEHSLGQTFTAAGLEVEAREACQINGFRTDVGGDVRVDSKEILVKPDVNLKAYFHGFRHKHGHNFTNAIVKAGGDIVLNGNKITIYEGATLQSHGTVQLNARLFDINTRVYTESSAGVSFTNGVGFREVSDQVAPAVKLLAPEVVIKSLWGFHPTGLEIIARTCGVTAFLGTCSFNRPILRHRVHESGLIFKVRPANYGSLISGLSSANQLRSNNNFGDMVGSGYNLASQTLAMLTNWHSMFPSVAAWDIKVGYYSDKQQYETLGAGNIVADRINLTAFGVSFNNGYEVVTNNSRFNSLWVSLNAAELKSDYQNFAVSGSVTVDLPTGSIAGFGANANYNSTKATTYVPSVIYNQTTGAEYKGGGLYAGGLFYRQGPSMENVVHNTGFSVGFNTSAAGMGFHLGYVNGKKDFNIAGSYDPTGISTANYRYQNGDKKKTDISLFTLPMSGAANSKPEPIQVPATVNLDEIKPIINTELPGNNSSNDVQEFNDIFVPPKQDNNTLFNLPKDNGEFICEAPEPHNPEIRPMPETATKIFDITRDVLSGAGAGVYDGVASLPRFVGAETARLTLNEPTITGEFFRSGKEFVFSETGKLLSGQETVTGGMLHEFGGLLQQEAKDLVNGNLEHTKSAELFNTVTNYLHTTPAKQVAHDVSQVGVETMMPGQIAKAIVRYASTTRAIRLSSELNAHYDSLADAAFAPGSASAAERWTVTARIKSAMLPRDGKIRFVPEPNYHPGEPISRGKHGGYLDKFGNEWYRSASRTNGHPFEWDVLLSETGKNHLGWTNKGKPYINVSIDGRISHGKVDSYTKNKLNNGKNRRHKL